MRLYKVTVGKGTFFVIAETKQGAVEKAVLRELRRREADEDYINFNKKLERKRLDEIYEGLFEIETISGNESWIIYPGQVYTP